MEGGSLCFRCPEAWRGGGGAQRARAFAGDRGRGADPLAKSPRPARSPALRRVLAEPWGPRRPVQTSLSTARQPWLQPLARPPELGLPWPRLNPAGRGPGPAERRRSGPLARSLPDSPGVFAGPSGPATGPPARCSRRRGACRAKACSGFADCVRPGPPALPPLPAARAAGAGSARTRRGGARGCPGGTVPGAARGSALTAGSVPLCAGAGVGGSGGREGSQRPPWRLLARRVRVAARPPAPQPGGVPGGCSCAARRFQRDPGGGRAGKQPLLPFLCVGRAGKLCPGGPAPGRRWFWGIKGLWMGT